MAEEWTNHEKIKKEKLNKEQRRPPSKVTRTKEPNLDLMAKAFISLYYETKAEEDDKKTFSDK